MSLTDIPFSPRRWPFFYGWVIVFASTVGIIASVPGQTMGVGVFTDYLIESLGLTRLQLSLAYMGGTIISSLILPMAGRVLDQIGARWMAVLSAMGLGLSMVVLSQSDRIAHIGGLRTLPLVLAVATFSFLLIRFFGQGCLTMASRVVIGKWFNHRRGIAAALQNVFVAFGFSSSPLILNELVQSLGWRETCLILAVLVGIGMAVFAWIFYRDNPEECGLSKDGVNDLDWHAKMAAKIPDVRHDFTRREAMRTLAFWVFTGGAATQSLIVTAVTFHISSIGETMNLDREMSYSIFLPMAFFSIVSNFITGWMSDRVSLKWVLLMLLLFQASGTVGLYFFGSPIGRWLLMAGYGAAGGAFAVMLTVTWPRFYGYRHLGAISGLNMSIMVFASAIGPMLFSAGYSLTKDYQAIIIVSLVLPLLLIPLCLKSRNPQEAYARD